MRRIVDFMNICIVTNRGCNLRCTHCYVDPELLASKFKMSEDNYQRAYARVKELLALDRHVKRMNIEVLGGEISAMPFEFWERQLPFSLEMAEEFRRMTGYAAAFAWCTNLIIQDDRYFDLINKYGDNPNWEVFIPWELDTNRFGSNNKLYPRYLKNLAKIDKAKKAINIIPTKNIVSMDMDEIKRFIRDGGFTDLSCDMLYPYGSGKSFFDNNQPAFHEVSQFYIRITEALFSEDWITISPWDEVSCSLMTGKGFNLNGNDAYDMTIEPDGSVVLNSSMTGSEAPLPSQTLLLDAENWAYKAFFENCSQMDVKFAAEFESCRQCENLRFCNGGYYHYKTLSTTQIEKYAVEDCAGYKQYWDYARDKLGDRVARIADLNHQEVRKKLRLKSAYHKAPEVTHGVRESELSPDYEGYFKDIAAFQAEGRLVVDKESIFGASVAERMWFYDGLGLKPVIDAATTDSLPIKAHRNIARNMIAGNYHSVESDPCVVWSFMRKFPADWVTGYVLDAISVLSNERLTNKENGYSVGANGLVIDERNDELFRFISNNKVPDDILSTSGNFPAHFLSKLSSKYLEKLESYLRTESLLIHRSRS